MQEVAANAPVRRGRPPKTTSRILTEPERWVSVDQACEILSCSRTTLLNYISKGEFGFSHPGGHAKLKLRNSDLQAFMMRNWHPPASHDQSVLEKLLHT